MSSSPPDDAWPALRQYLLDNLDDIGGWNTSHVKHLSERHEVLRAEDGRYYTVGRDGTPVVIIGARTQPETRIDFLSDQIIWRHGFLRQIAQMFSYFAITDDYARHPEQYPLSMKAVVPQFKYQSLAHDWHFMHFDRSRTVKWRPYPTFCDPEWLAADLLGE